MEKKPILSIQASPTDTLVETLGYLALLVSWGLVLYHFKSLPETIPVHYNYLGKADRFGSKASIFFLPIITTIIFVAMTIINRYPQGFNFPVRVTEDNAQRQYAIAKIMISYLKGSIALGFGLLTFQTIRNADHPDPGLGVWFLPIFLAVIFIPIIYFTRQSIKAK